MHLAFPLVKLSRKKELNPFHVKAALATAKTDSSPVEMALSVMSPALGSVMVLAVP